MKQVRIIVVLILSVLCIGLVYGGKFFYKQNTLTYIESITSVSFPAGISQIDVYDNGEFFLVTHVKLPKEDITLFRNTYGFDAVATQPKSLQKVLAWTKYLKSENQLLPIGDEFSFFEGCSENNTWMHVLDEDNGRLWSVIIYPDRSGDASPCSK